MIEATTASKTEIGTETEIEFESGVKSQIQIAPRDWCDTTRRSLPVAGTDTGSGGDGTLGRSSTVVAAGPTEVMSYD